MKTCGRLFAALFYCIPFGTSLDSSIWRRKLKPWQQVRRHYEVIPLTDQSDYHPLTRPFNSAGNWAYRAIRLGDSDQQLPQKKDKNEVRSPNNHDACLLIGIGIHFGTTRELLFTGIVWEGVRNNSMFLKHVPAWHGHDL
jgi:hypothetical protein